MSATVVLFMTILARVITLDSNNISQWGGGGADRGAGDLEKRGWEVYGRWEKSGGKRYSQGGGKREKKGKITQHCAIFRNRKNAKGGSQKIQGGNRD